MAYNPSSPFSTFQDIYNGTLVAFRQIKQLLSHVPVDVTENKVVKLFVVSEGDGFKFWTNSIPFLPLPVTIYECGEDALEEARGALERAEIQLGIILLLQNNSHLEVHLDKGVAAPGRRTGNAISAFEFFTQKNEVPNGNRILLIGTQNLIERSLIVVSNNWKPLNSWKLLEFTTMGHEGDLKNWYRKCQIQPNYKFPPFEEPSSDVHLPDYDWWIQKEPTSIGISTSKTLQLDEDLRRSLIGLSKVRGDPIGVDVILLFAFHRLLRIYGHTEETGVITQRTQLSPFLTLFNHEEFGPESILNVIQHLQDGMLQSAMKAYFESSSNKGNSAKYSAFSFDKEMQQESCHFSGFYCDTFGEETFSVRLHSDLVSANVLNQMLSTFVRMVEHIAENGNGAVAGIPYLTESELERMHSWNQTRKLFPNAAKTLPQIFSTIAELYSQRVAIVTENCQLTYRELDQRSDALASILLELPPEVIGPEKVIALFLDKSEYTFISILAVFKVGSAYVPLDPSYPSTRINSILLDTSAAVVILNRKYAKNESFSTLHEIEIEGVPIIRGIPIPPSPSTPESLAYVIFTSGTSEGRPRGVMAEHRHVTNYISDMSERNFGADAQDSGEVILQLSNYVFDLAVDQMWLGLANGFTCLIPPQNIWYDQESFYSFLQGHRVTHICGTPSFLKQFNWDRIQTLRRLIIGGEKLSSEVYRKLRGGSGRYELISIYGPTETTVIAAHFPLVNFTNCIGGPMANSAFYVLDSDMNPVPVGAMGELYIGGAGVCRGYLNQPELTAASFVANPFVFFDNFELLYKTVDLVRRLEDGNIEFIGRINGQVKIRGIRVEPSEIEHALLKMTQIEEASVVARDKGDGSCPFLVAYYVSPLPLVEKKIVEHLRQHLPDYMIPSAILRIESIPLTITGKLDKRRLPEPYERKPEKSLDVLSEQEEMMLQIWAESLPMCSQVGIDSNFFEIGGDSLSAMEIVGKIREVFGISCTVGEIFEFCTIRRLCSKMDWNKDFSADILPANKLAVDGSWECEANSLQQGFIFRHLHYPGDGSYIVQNLWQYHEPINVERLKGAWIRLIRKYPSLRLRFSWESRLVQLIDSSVELDWRYFPNPPSTPEVLLVRDREEGFDLSQSPLFRVYLIREGDELFSCLFSNHHAIIDGMSTALLLANLHDIYYGKGQEGSIDQVDMAYQLTQEYNQSQMDKEIQWWKSKTIGQNESKNGLIGLLKREHRHLVLNSYRHIQNPQKMTLVLDAQLLGSLRSFGISHGFTLQSIFQFAWHKCLSIYGSNEVTVSGLTLHGRSAPIPGIHHSVGPYVNTLPLFVHHCQGDNTVGMIRRIQETVQEMTLHECVPLASLSSQAERLFDNIFVYENYAVGLPGGTGVFEQVDYPLVVLVKEGQMEIKIQLTYDARIFEIGKVEQFLGTLAHVVEGIPLGRLSLMTEGQAEEIQRALCGPQVHFDRSLKLHHLFELQLKKCPDAVALVTESGHFTFRALDDLAESIHWSILAACPANPIVPTFFDDVSLLPAAILGIFKSGAGYSPIDPNLPSERIKFILTDICNFGNFSPCAILTTSKFRAQLDQLVDAAGLLTKLGIIEIDSPMIAKCQGLNDIESHLPISSEIACVIYTSGTTGTPKGVILTHLGLVNYCLHLNQTNYVTSGDLILSLLGWAFDGFWCALGPGLFGNAATAVLSPQTILDASAVVDFMISRQVTHVVGNPLHLTHLDLHRVESLKSILSAGSAMTESDATRLLLAGKRVLNGYGPTETSVISLIGEITRSNEVHIGKPLVNTKVVILNEDLVQVPPGTIGELYIAGLGISPGYLNLPVETETAFIELPFLGSGQRWHKSGDLVSLRPDGNLNYHGRRDGQVKVRGYRVNRAEVETLVASFPGVRWAVVAVGADEKLTAYVVMAPNSNLTDLKTELQLFLEGKIPDYMIPSKIIIVERIPLNSNGKVDYLKLRTLAGKTQHLEIVEKEQPSNSLQNQILHIWAKVLRIPPENLGVDDNFFRMGGDSISSIQIVSRLRQELGFEIRVGDIFDVKSIRGLAKLIKSRKAPNRSHLVGEQGMLTGQVPFLPIQDWFLSQFAPKEGWDFQNHFNQAFMLRVPPLDFNLLQKCVNSLHEFHDAFRLRLRFENGNMVQYYDEHAQAPAVHKLQHMAIRNSSEILSKIQSGFNLMEGPLLSVAYIESSGNGSCAVHVAAHHFVIDGVSWRILAGHLHQLYHGQKIREKGTSYRQWATSLRNHYKLGNNALKDEGIYWKSIVATLFSTPTSFSFCPKINSNLTISISKNHTAALLNWAPKAYNNDVQELLLTALAYALQEMGGIVNNWVTIEGHGREEGIVEDIDLSQTIGWFTTMFPFMLIVGETIEESIVGTKERLRNVPGKGIGYGLLIGYTNPPLPPITFNYLGVLGTGYERWDFMNEFCGDTSSGENEDVGVHLTIDVRIVQEEMYVEMSGTVLEGQLASLASLLQKWIGTIAEFGKSMYDLRGSHLTRNVVSAQVLDKIQNGREVEAVFRASSLQEGFIANHLSHTALPFPYHIQHVLNYSVGLDLEILKTAWGKVQALFPALRLRFNWEDSNCIQIVDKCGYLDFRVIDLCHLSHGERQCRIEATIQADSVDKFNLEVGPLFRVYAIKETADLVTLIFTHHHSILDGWSLNLLYSRLHSIYLALANQESQSDLVKLYEYDATYLDAQLWLQENSTVHHSWWKVYLGKIEEKVKLSGILRGQEKEISGTGSKTINLNLPPLLIASLKSTAASTRVTLNTLFLYAWHKVLSIFGSCSQTVVGVIVSGRDLPLDEIGSSVGCFINTIPLVLTHSNHGNDAPISDVLKSLQENLLEVNSRSSVRLAELGRLAPVGMGESLFESIFVYENYPKSADDSSLRLRMSSPRTIESQEFPLAVLVEEGDGDQDVACSVTYSQHLYNERQLNRLVTAMECMLGSIASDSQLALKDLCYRSKQEMALVSSWNSTAVPFPENLLIQELLGQKVVETPLGIAVVREGGNLNFSGLWQRINSLAAHLQKVITFDTEDVVLVPFFLTEPTLLIEVIFGILKAGGAYVPLDPTLTPSRMTSILAQVKSKVILTTSQHVSFLTSVISHLDLAPVLVLLDAEIDWERKVSVDGATAKRSSLDPAYIVFTSGSTGEPKGVIIPHRGLVNTVLEMGSFMGHKGDRDVVVPLFGWGFDAIWSAIGVGLLPGGTTVLPNPQTILDPQKLIEFCKVNGVTQVHGNPLLVQQLPLHEIHSLNTVCVAGDSVGMTFVSQFHKRLPGVTLINGYGPTETSVGVILEKVEDEEEVTIGKCIGNVTAYVVDSFGVEVPIGVTGELLIGGVAVGIGYLGDQERMQEVFLPNPYGEGRIFKSGDLVRWTEQGKLVYVGRRDFQMKLRGYRVHLGEIESSIESLPGISKSVVLNQETRDGGKSRLIAYIVPVDGDCPSKEAIFLFLESKLPQYMIPSTIIFLFKLPLNSNGKLDRAKLPLGEEEETVEDDVHLAPRTPLESLLCHIWAKVLNCNVAKIGIGDNFFRLGGDSVSSIQIVGKIRSELGNSFPVTVRDILNLKTIESLVGSVPYTPEIQNLKVPHETFQNGHWSAVANSLQQGLVYHHKSRGREKDAYVVQKIINYGVALDLIAMKSAWEIVYSSYPGLRVRFDWQGSEILQLIDEISEPMDWRETTCHSQSDFEDFLLSDRLEGFDLQKGQLLRIYFTKMGSGFYRALLTIHHAICDGWSIGILLAKVHSVYLSILNGKPVAPPAVDLAYLQGQRYLERMASLHLAFWENEVRGINSRSDWSSLSLPNHPEYSRGDDPKFPKTAEYLVRTDKIYLKMETMRKICNLIAEVGVTPNAFFQFAWHRILRIFGHTDETIVGTTVSGRDLEIDGIQESVGLFMATIPLILDHAQLDTCTGIEGLRLVHDKLITLQGKSSIKLSSLKGISFDSIFAFENYPTTPEDDTTDEELKVEYSEGISLQDYPLLLTVTLRNHHCRLELQSSMTFDPTATSRLLATLVTYMENMLEDIEGPATSYAYLGQGEISQIICANSFKLPKYEKTILDYFKDHVVRCPDHIAVVHNSTCISYAELDILSDSVCAKILEDCPEGAGRDFLVPICVGRNHYTQVGILGILKTGSAYVPIDPSLPLARIRDILADISATLVVTTTEHAHLFPSLKTVLVDSFCGKTDENVAGKNVHSWAKVLPTDLAYGIYTSGTSTGKPKGCLIEHRNLINYLEDTTVRLFGPNCAEGSRTDEVLLQLASTTFDPSVDQIFLALYNGFTSVVPDAQLWMDKSAFGIYCTANLVTNIFGTPSMLKLLNLQDIPTLRSVRVAGEKISFDAYDRIKGHGMYEVANVCGPTETTVVCTYKRMQEFTYSVGGPIANVSFYIVDPSGTQFVPLGTIGELYIGGAGVGRGYLNQPQLNHKHFVPNRWGGEGKVYCSGDLVRRLPLGEVEFIGRRDGQVKVRGYRVELGEIETQILKHGSISEAAVVVKSQGLVAYYVSTTEVESSELVDQLSLTLPGYMIPLAFVRIENIPLTHNGKLDMTMLPPPQVSSGQKSLESEPHSEAEKEVMQVCADILKHQIWEIRRDDTFLSLGGDSITALLVAEKLNQKFHLAPGRLTVREVLEFKTVSSLVELCTEKDVVAPGTWQQCEQNKVAALDNFLTEKVEWVGKANSLQEGFLAHFLRREKEDNSYLVQVVWRYDCAVDVQALERAWQNVYSKFPGLRLRFDWSTSEYIQIVPKAEFCHFDWRWRDWSEIPAHAQEEWLEKLRVDDRFEYFDLVKGNLLRVYLIKCGPSKYFCLSSNHHSILDGWSSSILFSAVHELYLQLTQVDRVSVVDTSVDMAYLRAQEFIDIQSTSDTEHWKAIMAQVEDVADFKSLTPIPAHSLDVSHLVPIVINFGNIASPLCNFPATFGITTNTLLQFTWHRVLHIFLRMRQTVVGTTVSGRNLPIHGIVNSVGLFINTLPLILDHSLLDGIPLVEALENVQSNILELNSKCTGKLRSLHPPHSSSGRPFESLFIFENFPDFVMTSDLPVTDVTVHEELDFPLVLTIRASGNTFSATLLYSQTFESPAISSLLSSFEFVLGFILDKMATGEAATVLCSQIPYCLSPWDKVEEIPRACAVESSKATHSLHSRFNEIVQLQEDKVALVWKDGELTYGQLDILSNNLARRILKIGRESVGPDMFVALCMEKSEWMIIGILGIIKTGSAYVPIDPKTPLARMRKILEDCKPSILVTHKSHSLPSQFGINVIDVEVGIKAEAAEDSQVALDGSGHSGHNLAYVIYTSGTSGGGPKGCMNEHHSVINLIDSLTPKYFLENMRRGNARREVILQLANYDYDLSVLQIWLALLNGHTLLLPPPLLVLDLDGLTEFMALRHVTHVSGTPSYLKLIKWGNVESLRRVVVGGEMLTSDAWSAICSSGGSFRIINEYGPTETTVTSSLLEMKEYRVGIGEPIDNTIFYVLDECLRMMPDCAIGELCIGGRGLARGYLNLPELTNQKFIQDPFRVGQKLYRTGDLARRLPGGSFELIGRSDSQVKIRGQRVELGEVQHWVKEFEGVTDAIVVTRSVATENSGEVLVAYFVSVSEISKVELREWLLEKLPSCAVPSVFVQIERIPLGSTGKVNVGALPNPSISAELNHFAESALEKEIVTIWSQVLNLDANQVGIDEDFYGLGGDSLLLMQMLQNLQEATGVRLKVTDIYHEKTIRKMARAIEKAPSVGRVEENPKTLHSFRLCDYPTFNLYEEIKGEGERIFLFPPGLGGVGSYLGNIAPLLNPHPLVLFNNFYEFLKGSHGVRISYQLAAKEYLNEIKKLQAVGPYHLVGWSWGGVMAFEIARQMAEEGNLLGTVCIIDSLFSIKSALCEEDAERLRRQADISYMYNPPVTPGLSTVKFVLFKAMQVVNVGVGKSEDDALDERIYSYYVNKTKTNHLKSLLPPQTSLKVVSINSNHFKWFEDNESIGIIALEILKVIKNG